MRINPALLGVVAGHRHSGDPFFASVVLLAHMDGANDGVLLPDVKLHSNTNSVPNPVLTKTATKKFGTAAAFCSASRAYYSPAFAGEFVMTGDWTVEFWVNPSAQATQGYPLGMGGDFRFYLADEAGALTGYLQHLGGSASTATGAIALNVWSHIAIVRNGNQSDIYVNGISTVVAAPYVAGTPVDSNPLFWIGYDGETFVAQSQYKGYIDDFRYTKAARYTANFTPPAAAFPDAP